jgi:hypothetical protein
MLHYPPSLTKVCKGCGAIVTLERQGSGRPYEGRLDYWYTTAHHCPEGNQTIEAKETERQTLEELLSESRFC